jgi:Rrf2 family protein
MSILFSRHCEYALQAVLFLARRGEGATTTIRELTDALHTPYFFMAKILQDLSHKGLLLSHKGSSGGFALARPSNEIALFDIIEAVDGRGLIEECVLGFPSCSPDHQCAMHDQWSKSRDAIHELLINKTVAEMAAAMKKPEYVNSVGQTFLSVLL